MFEHQRIRAGPLDRTTNPPTAAGRRVERVLTVAVVAQQTDSTGQLPRVFRLRNCLDKESLQRRQAAFAGAGSAREFEERIAVIERENK